MEITIEGLNAQQQVLADIIWACDTRDRVDAFIRALPTETLRNQARVIVDLMVLAVVEHDFDPNLTEAEQVLRKYNTK
jgi:hypothetical protein